MFTLLHFLNSHELNSNDMFLPGKNTSLHKEKNIFTPTLPALLNLIHGPRNKFCSF